MIEISFSLMGTEAEVQNIQPWVDEFERQQHVHVNLMALDWVSGWEKIVDMALHGNAPDVSEIGSTWTASLASMNALRPYSAMEIRALGDKRAFLDSSWDSCSLPGDTAVWAVPWLSDVHILYYRRDALEKGNIPADFGSPAGLERTLTALQQAGHRYPLSLIVEQEPNLMHDAASWVWSEGGSFLDTSGVKVAFDQDQALRGFLNYFNLRRFLASGYADNQGSWNKFLNSERLVAIGTPAHYFQAQHRNPEDVKTWGAASVVGSSFVGGTNLVIWKNPRQITAALEFVRFLEAKATGFPASPHAFRTPCRMDAWNQLQSADDILVKSVVEAIKTGRSYKINPLWSVVEKGLILELATIWRALLNDPASDVETTVREALTFRARRLNLSLAI